MPPVKFMFKPRYVGDVEALGYHPSLPLGLRHRILEQGIKVFGTVQIYYVLIGNSKKYKMRNPAQNTRVPARTHIPRICCKKIRIPTYQSTDKGRGTVRKTDRLSQTRRRVETSKEKKSQGIRYFL